MELEWSGARPVHLDDRPIRPGATQTRARSREQERSIAVEDVSAGQQLDNVAGVERSLQLGELVRARRPDRGGGWALERQRCGAGAIAGMTEVLRGQREPLRTVAALEANHEGRWLECRGASRDTA